MRLGRVWYILYCFVFLCSLVGYPQVSEGEGLVSLIGLDLSKKEEIGFIFSQDKVDKDYAKEYPLKYFFTSLVVPNDELWVNLSPRLGDTEIIGEGISNTDLGRLMLYYDLKLKHDVEKLLKIYGDEIDEYMENLGKDVNLRFWIEPGVVEMEVDGRKGIIKLAPLEVKVEVDGMGGEGLKNWLEREVAAVVRERVNRGEGYARLRQAYNSMILAQWYKGQVREGVAFSEYVDSRAKGEGIISDGVWFRSAYLEEYVRMYLGEDSKDEGWASVVVGGIRGEVKRIEEIPKQVPDMVGIRVRDRSQEIQREAEELKRYKEEVERSMYSLKENDVVAKFCEGITRRKVKDIEGNITLSDLNNKHAPKGPIHMKCKGSKFEMMSFNSSQEWIILRNPDSPKISKSALDLFLSRLREGRDVWLIMFLSKELIEESIEYGMSATLTQVLALYNRGVNRVILLREGKSLDERGGNKLVSAFNSLPSFALLGREVILVDGGVGVVESNVEVRDIVDGSYDLSRYFEVRRCGLLEVHDGTVILIYSDKYGKIAQKNNNVEGKVLHTSEGDVEFMGDTLDRVIDVLSGKKEEEHTYLAIDRNEKGMPVVFLYDEKEGGPLSLEASVVEVTQQGIGPGFLYNENGMVVGVLPSINEITWQILPRIREAIDRRIREKYCGDKEKISNGIGIRGAREVRLRGIDEKELEAEIEKILEYKGSRDIYVWIKPECEGEYNLIFQAYRPVIYTKEEEQWALLRLNHQTGWIDVLRQGGLEKNVIYTFVQAIKKRFIYSGEQSSSGWIGLDKVGEERIWKGGKKGEWVVGKEFYLPNGASVRIRKEIESSMEEKIVTISWKHRNLILSIEKKTQSPWDTSSKRVEEKKISRSERIFLNDRLEIVKSPYRANFIIELGEDDFIRVIGIKREGVMMSTRTQVNLIEIEEGNSRIIRYKGRDYRDRQVELINKGKELIIHGQKDKVVVRNFPSQEDILVNDDFQIVSDEERARFRIAFGEKRVSVASIGDAVWLPVVHMRDIIYEDREEIRMSSWKIDYRGQDKYFFWSAIGNTDGYIMTQHTDEFIVIDWNRDMTLRSFYGEVIEELLRKLREEGEIGLSEEKIERLGKALVRGDRTEVESIMRWVNGDVKSHLLQWVYRILRSKMRRGYKEWEKERLFFVGDAMEDKGVCRHFAPVITAVLQRLSTSGFLLGQAYLFSIPKHTFCLYITGVGIPVILDIAQKKFLPVTETSHGELYYTFSPIPVPRRKDLLKVDCKKLLEIAGIKVPRDSKSRVHNGVNAFLSKFVPSEESHYISISASLCGGDVNTQHLPEILRELLCARFYSNQPEGAVLDVIRYLYGNKSLHSSDSREPIENWETIKKNLVKVIDKKLEEEAKIEFITEWNEISVNNIPTKIFRFLSLMHRYKLYEIVPEVYETMVRQAGGEFARLVKGEDPGMIEKAMDDLAYYSEKYVSIKLQEDTKKGGLVLSLQSLVLI